MKSVNLTQYLYCANHSFEKKAISLPSMNHIREFLIALRNQNKIIFNESFISYQTVNFAKKKLQPKTIGRKKHGSCCMHKMKLFFGPKAKQLMILTKLKF